MLSDFLGIFFLAKLLISVNLNPIQQYLSLPQDSNQYKLWERSIRVLGSLNSIASVHTPWS